MAKVGIFTFQRAHNYGAALQAYALRETLDSFGHKAEVIDYGAIGETQRFNFQMNGIKPFVYSMFLNFLSITNADIRRYRFRKFMKLRMGVTKDRYKEKTDLITLNDTFDFFITGSDQVWNTGLTKSDKTFLLDFVKQPEKKISYAASFGISALKETDKAIFKTHLPQFNKISVREQAGQKIVRELTGKEPSLVLDPTFLLKKEEWEKIAKPYKHHRPYILCFSIMADRPGFIKFCRHLQKLTGYDVVRVANPLYKLESGIKTIATAGPQEFLGLIKDASIVLTNSFHGTAFSIIFQKPFFTFLYNDEHDIRLKEITEKLGIGERLINSSKVMLSESEIEIDYANVQEKLDNYTDLSFKFLKNILQ